MTDQLGVELSKVPAVTLVFGVIKVRLVVQRVRPALAAV